MVTPGSQSGNSLTYFTICMFVTHNRQAHTVLFITVHCRFANMIYGTYWWKDSWVCPTTYSPKDRLKN